MNKIYILNITLNNKNIKLYISENILNGFFVYFKSLF